MRLFLYSAVLCLVVMDLTAAPGHGQSFANRLWEDEAAAQDWPEGIADQDPGVAQAAWFQPPSVAPATPQPSTVRSPRAAQLANLRLASVPNMFGDLPMATSTVITRGIDGQTAAFATSATLPLNAGSRVGKISENDSPIPQDRVFFSYNHFQNVFQLSERSIFQPQTTTIRQEPLDRYTLGLEKTFFDGWTSFELRMPLIGSFDTQLQSVGISGGNIGNLTAVFKSLLYMDYGTAIGAGMAVETPTGSDSFTRFGTATLQFRNQSAHLLPYIGFIWSPGDPRWGWGDGLFLTGFAQIDLNTRGNVVNVRPDSGVPATSLGLLTDQNLGFLDLGAGYWLFRDPYAPRLTGLAAITELHYTTTLQDADRLAATVNNQPFVVGNSSNRFDVLNGTIGVQALLFEASSLRVAGVFPIGNEDRRLFDSEVQVQFNRRF
jgi:hypothetical protein